MGKQEHIGANTHTAGLNKMAKNQDGCRHVCRSTNILSIMTLMFVSNFAENEHRNLISVT